MSKSKVDQGSAGRRLGGLSKASWLSDAGASRVPTLATKLVTELKQQKIEIDYVEVHADGLIRAGKYPSDYQIPGLVTEVSSVLSKDDLWDRWGSKF